MSEKDSFSLDDYTEFTEGLLQKIYDKTCAHDIYLRIFFEGPVKLIQQAVNGATYELEHSPDVIIKVPNMTHLRLAEYPYPEYFNILAPVIDRRLWGQKKIVKIKFGKIPRDYLTIDSVEYYLLQKRIYG